MYYHGDICRDDNMNYSEYEPEDNLLQSDPSLERFLRQPLTMKSCIRDSVKISATNDTKFSNDDISDDAYGLADHDDDMNANGVAQINFFAKIGEHPERKGFNMIIPPLPELEEIPFYKSSEEHPNECMEEEELLKKKPVQQSTDYYNHSTNDSTNISSPKRSEATIYETSDRIEHEVIESQKENCVSNHSKQKSDDILFEVKEKPKIFKIIRKKISKVNFREQVTPCGEALKNVVKNYGKQITKFIKHPLGKKLALPYLHHNKRLVNSFCNFIKSKPEITNMNDFRNILLPVNNDPDDVKMFKGVFQCLSIDFIKHFSHNWIFNSNRISDKWAHVYAKSKILRRVENPEYFTYLT